MLYNKSPIMWRSKLQKTTALSTAEAEYYSALAAGCKVLYLWALLRRLGFGQKKSTPIYEENTACIEWGNNVIGGRERAVSTQAPNGASRAVGTHHGPTRIHAPTGAYAIGGTAKLAQRCSIISATAAARTLPQG